MSAHAVAILNTGLVTSVGLDAPTTCAAIRAKLTNPNQTRFIDSDGEWITGHVVPMEPSLHGLAKLTRMAVPAIREAMRDVPARDWDRVPLLLCVAEKERPGRTTGLDDQLFTDIRASLNATFAAQSAVVAHGRVSVAVALLQARALIHEHQIPCVLIAAVDSLLSWPTLSQYEWQRRLLTPLNSNGFMPGEGAGALLVGKAGAQPCLQCTGAGFGVETAHVDSEQPLRADGMTHAIKTALVDAGREMHDMSFRITDLSGEHYYFKEASLALSRTLHRPKEEFDLWHPAECTGETGALAGATMVALADAACRKNFAKGPAILAHMANDNGQRAALSLHFGRA